MDPVSEIKRQVGRRPSTDRYVSAWLVLAPAILSSLATAVMIAGGVLSTFTYGAGSGPEYSYSSLPAPPFLAFTIPFAVAIALYLVAGAVGFYACFLLVERRNRHLERTYRLFRAFSELAKSKGVRFPEGGLEGWYWPGPAWRDGFLYAAAAFGLPFFGFYLAHVLNRDFHRHELRERELLRAASEALDAMGAGRLGVRLDPKGAVPERNTWLYAVLTVVTLGLFSLYWAYTLARDPNRHFDEHARWEEALLAKLSKIS